MRHRKSNNNLKRKSSHRKAMLANMSCSLILHKRIKTTLAKAKVLKKFIEPISFRLLLPTILKAQGLYRELSFCSAYCRDYKNVAHKILGVVK